MILIVFLLEFVAYLLIMMRQRMWYRRGELTESRFVLPQVGNMTLLVMLGMLAVSLSLQGFLWARAGGVLTWAIGYPVAKWIYRRVFPPK